MLRLSEPRSHIRLERVTRFGTDLAQIWDQFRLISQVWCGESISRLL
jgi:hypothetical protein